jgi:hypothetical protein
VLAVGAALESSSATGINGKQADISVIRSGAVYLFTRSGATWSQQAYVKASTVREEMAFGSAIALTADTLVVGAERESSSATGINGSQADAQLNFSGAAYVLR